MSASSATTLTSPHNGLSTTTTMASASSDAPPAPAAAPAPRRTHSRISTHSAHAHGHGHGHAHGHGHTAHHGTTRRTSGHTHTHGAHTAHASSRSNRRGSDGEGGRRAVAAGLAMHVLDAAARPAVVAAAPGKAKRKTSDPYAGAVPAAPVARPGATKANRSDTALPRLSRTPSVASNMSRQSSESGRTTSGPGRKRAPSVRERERGKSADRGKSRERPRERAVSRSRDRRTSKEERRASREVDRRTSKDKEAERRISRDKEADRRVSRDRDVEVQVLAGDDEDQEDEDWESGEGTPADMSRRESVREPSQLGQVVAAGDSAIKGAIVESPLELRPTSPGHEPPATQRTTGFPDTPTRLGLETDSRDSSRPPSRPQSVLSSSRPVSLRGNSSVAIDKLPASSTPGDGAKSGDDASFPFPAMTSSPKRTASNLAFVSSANDSGESSTPSSDTAASGTGATGTRQPSLPNSTHARAAAKSRVDAQPIALRRPPSHASLRSIQSLRAPPHPLNSPTGGRSGLAAMDSPRQKRVASLHYPPAAPAVVYRETVEGQGWDEVGTSPTGAPAPPPVRQPAQEQLQRPRPERVGSFSSVRSFKDRLVGSGAPAPPSPARTISSSQPSHHRGPQPRRLTAMQQASAVSRLNTTSDPVAYHQSLGFSPATAETAHLLSRFLPVKTPRRPTWAISARDAISGDAEGRVGLTDGQYRDAHEALVETLRGLAQSGGQGRVRGVPRSYTQTLLGGPGEEGVVKEVPRKGQGETPFVLAAGRCLAQRPRGLY